MQKDATDVAAGLIFRNGKLLITQRPPGAHLEGLWEFPGGKRERHETFEQCLIRELREELGIEVFVRELIEEITHTYSPPPQHGSAPIVTVRLKFFRCELQKNEPRPLGCPDFKWVTAQELRLHQFPAADAELLTKLQRDPTLWAVPKCECPSSRTISPGTV